MIKNHLLILFILTLPLSIVYAGNQDSLKLNCYIETYYSVVPYQPANHPEAPDFLCSYSRNNEVNLNLGFLKLSWNNENVRTNFGLMTGTYANKNLKDEPSTLKNIYEANAGISLTSKKNLWIDVGVFQSHIGFESAIGKDCWTLSRSILADNSPYYETGIKISKTTNDQKWTLTGLLLNGWQRIQRTEGNTTPCFGHQLIWKPSVNTTFNSSSFIGNVYPDSARRIRYFHNFYGQTEWGNTGLIIGFDMGAEQKMKGSTSYQFWYAPVVVLKNKLSDKFSISARAEYYSDKHHVIISGNKNLGFQTFGSSINLDIHIHKNAMLRLEGRSFHAKEKIFVSKTSEYKSIFFLTGSFAFYI